nr:NADH dehydrogenase subunit 4L [Haematopinus apri]
MIVLSIYVISMMNMFKVVLSSNMMIALLSVEFLSVSQFYAVLFLVNPSSLNFNSCLVLLSILVLEGTLGLTILVSTGLKIDSTMAESMSCVKF